MIRSSTHIHRQLSRVPRASGDDPNLDEGGGGGGVFPARAGMIRNFYSGYRSLPGVPRASGDDPLVNRLEKLMGVCSPRERG